MQVRTRAQAIWTVIFITATAVAVSLVLAALAIPLTDFEADWHHWFFAIVFPTILTPVFCVPLVNANFRLMRMQGQLEKMAMTDSLTGLPNRRAFFRNAARIFSTAEALGLPVAVMMIDVDNFKRINDSYGHEVGDDVIGRVANSIREAVTDCDGAMEGFAARVGGDEFAVVIASKGHDSVVSLARCIGDEVRRIGYIQPGDGLVTTVSIGVAVRGPGEGIDAVLAAADQAAYKAKDEGRDRFVLADGSEAHRDAPRRGRSGSRAA